MVDLLKKRYNYFVALILILIKMISSVRSNTSNLTKNLYAIDEEQEDELLYSLKRLPRFLSFQALDEDLKVDLEFGVPFIKIPVKKTKDAATSITKSLANINISALVLTGLIVLMGVSVGSIFSSAGGGFLAGLNPFRLQKMSSILEPIKFSYKDSRGIKTETALHDVFDDIENMFQSSDVDISSCIQKAICFLVKSSSDKVTRGRGSSTNKIIDGLASSKWLLDLIDGTAIKDAIETAKRSRPCSYKYQYCRWSESEISEILVKFL